MDKPVGTPRVVFQVKARIATTDRPKVRNAAALTPTALPRRRQESNSPQVRSVIQHRPPATFNQAAWILDVDRNPAVHGAVGIVTESGPSFYTSGNGGVGGRSVGGCDHSREEDDSIDGETHLDNLC